MAKKASTGCCARACCSDRWRADDELKTPCRTAPTLSDTSYEVLTLRFLLLLASLIAAAVAAPPAKAEPQTLRIGMRDDPDILDPTFSRTYVGTVVMTALCDKLFDFDEKLNIVPTLAKSYEWADSK